MRCAPLSRGARRPLAIPGLETLRHGHVRRFEQATRTSGRVLALMLDIRAEPFASEFVYPAYGLRLTQSHLYVQEDQMHGIIYLVGLVVVILAILSFFGIA